MLSELARCLALQCLGSGRSLGFLRFGINKKTVSQYKGGLVLASYVPRVQLAGIGIWKMMR